MLINLTNKQFFIKKLTRVNITDNRYTFISVKFICHIEVMLAFLVMGEKKELLLRSVPNIRNGIQIK